MELWCARVFGMGSFVVARRDRVIIIDVVNLCIFDVGPLMWLRFWDGIMVC